MFPDDLAMFQYYKGISFGVMIGISLAWLYWRLPVHARTWRTKKLRRIVLDMRRIEASFTEASLTGKLIQNTRELRVHRIPIRDRLSESWAAWKAATTPRTPEQVALEVQRRVLAGVP